VKTFVRNRKRTVYHVIKDKEFSRSFTVGMFDL
jgi:hypothetical protein